MSGTTAAVFFDQNEHGTYYSGQVVTGRVVISVTKSKKFKGIKLQFCGYAACQWRKKNGGETKPVEKVKKNKRHIYHAHEDYIASTTFLAGSEDGQPVTLDIGTYHYTFACPIPPNCPSSFEGAYGHIRYLAKVTFLRQGSSNRTHNVGFTVLKIVDLNQESPLLRAPVNNEALESFCFISSKSVSLRVDLQQSGFVPGQHVLVSAFVNNDSDVDCRKLLVILLLRATYTADVPRLSTAREKITLVKKVCGPVPKHTEKHFAESIRIPATPPTCETISKIVRVSYEICVVAVMNHLIVDPKAIIPITIGNVPLTDRGVAPPQLPYPTVASFDAQCAAAGPIMMAAPIAVAPCDGPTTSARAVAAEASAVGGVDEGDFETADEDEETDDEGPPEIAPPSYEEAIFMTRNIADTDANTESENTQFTPRYPVYNVDSVLDAELLTGPGNPNGGGIIAPPNPPEKRRRRKKKAAPAQPGAEPIMTEKPPIE